jgi:hypothetical protein
MSLTIFSADSPAPLPMGSPSPGGKSVSPINSSTGPYRPEGSHPVAAHLGRTLETHRRTMIRKLDRHNISEMTEQAIREGISSLDR